MKKTLTIAALILSILGAGAAPALAHNAGKPGEYGKEKYQTNCASGRAVRPVQRVFPAINKPNTRIVQTGRTKTNRDGKHYHYVNVQKLRDGRWVTVERNKLVPCGVTKTTRILSLGNQWN